ncbi:MAG: tetratricopeptide repeat protein [Deltaproteobacteria bacterium]|nr:tetratricopeptide repeat protein [Deltaproteobacteria bacterium]
MPRLRPALLALVLGLTPLAYAQRAHAQDWDVGPQRPQRPQRPPGVRRPPGTRPPGVRPPTVRPPTTPPSNPPPGIPVPAANVNERRERMIAHLLETVLRNPEDSEGPLPALLRLARERDGSIDRLLADVEQRAAAAPNNPSPSLLLGHLYRDAGRLDDALAAYTRAEALAPGSPQGPRARAQLLSRMDRRADARSAYDQALTHTSEPHAQAELLRALMDLALGLDDLDGARAYHQRLLGLERTSVAARRELAEALLARRRYVEAIAEYESVARALTGDNRVLPPVLRDLARAQLEAGQLDACLATLRRALGLAGGDAGVRRELYDLLREAHVRLHDVEAWVAELERAGAGDFDRAMLLARLHDELGHGDAAVAALRRAITLRPADIDAHVRLVQLLTQLARLDELLTARRRLVAIAPRNPDYVLDLAEELMRRGQRVEALRVLAQASARAGNDPDLHRRLALRYEQFGERDLAVREQEIAARQDPSPDSLGELADRYLERGDRERALGLVRRMTEGSRDPRDWCARAEWYAAQGMISEGVDVYREALHAYPDDLELHKGLAVLLERNRAFADAVAAWRRVLELARNDRDLRREARARIVNLWNLQGVLAAQAQALAHGFEQEPPDLEAGRDLAEAYLRLRRTEEAEQVLARLVSLDHGDVATMITLERVRVQRGDLSGAIEVLRRLVAADPSHAREWYQRIAQHALALHRDEEAIDSAAHAVQLNPDDAQAHLRLGELYRTRGDTDHAVASFRRALELNDRLFPTYFELADLYLGRDEPRDAVTLYRRVVRLAPDDELVARAGRMAIQVAPVAGVAPELERDLFAATVAAPTRVVLRRLLVDLYASLCRPLIAELRHGSPEVSARARESLQRLGTRALKPLLDALGDPDTAQQHIALDILGYLGNPNATAALLTVAEGTGEAELRREALRAAAALADPRTIPRLVALQNSQDGVLATLATYGLGRMRTPAALQATLRATRAELPDVRAMALLSLAGQRDPRARAALLAGLTASEDIVRAAAAWALRGTTDPTALAHLRASLRGPALLRAAAVDALASGATPTNTDTLARELAPGLFAPGDRIVRRVTARALVALAGGAPRVAPRALTDPAFGSSPRALLLAALDPADGPPLVGTEALVRFAETLAGSARSALTLQESLGVLLDALEGGAVSPLASAGEVGSSEAARSARGVILRAAAPSLASLVGVGDPAVRRRLVAVLEGLDEPSTTEALARAAADPDLATAEAALRALAGRAANADEALLRTLTGRCTPATPWRLRVAAVGALGHSPHPTARSALLAALGDDYAYVREAAVRGLRGRGADPAVREALQAVRDRDPDESVRTLAREALEGGGP